MTLSERDLVYVEHMLECIERVERFIGQGRNQFMQSDLVQDAVVRNLQTLAESGQRLSEEVKNTQTGVDWRAIAGFRNVLVQNIGLFGSFARGDQCAGTRKRKAQSCRRRQKG
jgi:uncharacterized protein with HEPN domain